ncbi:hypothetical protein GCM10010946_20420 [Undibacterium squillarum]|uniref:Uncharacterized protein n=1 Tax=Undibacterium squillarum TaxID=1131567 RepID=A0ABQ2Y046_9BURK|nr:hypothetical protein GCM10010946_20420 [Undibacterium squillarum]
MIANISNLSGMGMKIAAVFGEFAFKDLAQWQGMIIDKIIISKAAERAGWTIGGECECSEK